MKLVEIKLEVSEVGKDMVSDFLLGMGASGVAEDILDNLDKENKIKVLGYFSEDTNFNLIIEKLKNYLVFLKQILPNFEWSEILLEDSDPLSWEGWRKELKTIKVGSRVVIRPPWEDYSSKKGEIVTEINPAFAFGTGHHESTRLCIEGMEAIFKKKKVETVLDVGCGSGILAICAVKLGAKWDLALDIDPVAVREAKNNIERNKVSRQVFPLCGSLEAVGGKFGLVLANINAEEIIGMRRELKSRLKKEGVLLVSGILEVKSSEVVKGFQDIGLGLKRELAEGEWVAQVFTLR